MSRENVEIVRAYIDAWNRGDQDAALKYLAPEFELDFSRATGPQHGVFRRDQLPGLWDEWAREWKSAWEEADEFIEAGEQVVVSITSHAQGRGGIELTARPAYVVTLRDGAIVSACMYQAREDALKAAGLRE
jgi:ketosteroid isomerase-like protein